jgi:RNase P subunit RPR2
MKILIRGKLPEERRWRATCKYCETQFACLQSEGRLTSDGRDGDTLVVECPVCQRDCYGSHLG